MSAMHRLLPRLCTFALVSLFTTGVLAAEVPRKSCHVEVSNSVITFTYSYFDLCDAVRTKLNWPDTTGKNRLDLQLFNDEDMYPCGSWAKDSALCMARLQPSMTFANIMKQNSTGIYKSEKHYVSKSDVTFVEPPPPQGEVDKRSNVKKFTWEIYDSFSQGSRKTRFEVICDKQEEGRLVSWTAAHLDDGGTPTLTITMRAKGACTLLKADPLGDSFAELIWAILKIIGIAILAIVGVILVIIIFGVLIVLLAAACGMGGAAACIAACCSGATCCGLLGAKKDGKMAHQYTRLDANPRSTMVTPSDAYYTQQQAYVVGPAGAPNQYYPQQQYPAGVQNNIGYYANDTGYYGDGSSK